MNWTTNASLRGLTSPYFVTVWMQAQRGRGRTSRSIEVPAWHEIAANYPASLRSALAPLLDAAWRPDGNGRLLLWHGVPGTGKTFALRALAWEWRDWCSL